jgi:hypothetical protein
MKYAMWTLGAKSRRMTANGAELRSRYQCADPVTVDYPISSIATRQGGLAQGLLLPPKRFSADALSRIPDHDKEHGAW